MSSASLTDWKRSEVLYFASQCAEIVSQVWDRLRKAIEFREMNFYAGLGLVIWGGDALATGAGRLLAGAVLVFYAVWTLRPEGLR